MDERLHRVLCALRVLIGKIDVSVSSVVILNYECV
jgi:hypothetical protein